MHATFNWTAQPSNPHPTSKDTSRHSDQPSSPGIPNCEQLSQKQLSNEQFYRDVLMGLSATPKQLPCKYFYDERGSELFNQICNAPEYYPTRAEMEILRAYADEIAFLAGEGIDIVELGSCNSRKVRVLLDSLKNPRYYVPVDVSVEHLHESARHLKHDYPRLEVLPVAADFTRIAALPDELRRARRTMFFFAGSTIGNFDPDQAILLLQQLAQLSPRSFFLIGVDIKKDIATLEAAYNDAQGLTSAFNLNLLQRINEELRGNFDLSKFRHRAFYNAQMHRIEMHLESLADQKVRIGDRTISFEQGERVHTENSYKYGTQHFQAMARAAGLLPVRWWQDSQRLFSLHLLVKAADSYYGA